MKRQFLLCALLINISSQCADNEPAPLPTPLDPQSKELAITYKAMQYIIHELTAQIAKEVEKDGQAWISMKEDEINPYKSEQGLYLLVDNTVFSLHTPLGTKKLGKVSHQNIGSVFEKFRKHLTLGFVKNVGEFKEYSYSSDWKDMRFYVDTSSNKITREELDKYRGSDKLIRANFCGYDSAYKILAVGDTVLPESKKLETASHKDAQH